MTGKTILLVEDNPDDEAMMLFALRKNHSVSDIIITRDGEQALDRLFPPDDDAHPPPLVPDLILLDLKLPKINGIEVLRRIRHEPRTHLIPVVVLTTSDEAQDRIRSYELHANSFIRKPVDFDKFIEIMRHIELYWLTINETPSGDV